MFVRAKRSVHASGTYEYLQIVESFRDGDKVRQRVIATLGRRDQIVADGSLDALLASMARFSERLRVVEKVRSEGLQARDSRAWGPALVFRRLWEEQDVPAILSRLTAGRHFEFDVERAAFALALQRLCEPGSDRRGARWLRSVECPGFEQLDLQHLYRTVAFLGEAREHLERDLFLADRDLFSQQLDLVFIDTTSTYVYRDEPTELRKRGYSRDRRPDLHQIVLCVAVDQRGWPIAWDILPGNTADKPAFVAMVTRLRERFQIRRCVVVADRGMISKTTLALLDQPDAPFGYVLGCRMRAQKEVNEDVLARAGRYRQVADNLEVKEVFVGNRRYVVCRNPIEQRKDAEARQAIVGKLRETLNQGPKALVGNKGYARFLTVAKGSMAIDEAKVEADARLDGKFVLRANCDLPAHEVALAYKGLWQVERAFREEKSTLELRPIFHQRDDTCIGHLVGCFLALRLEVDLQRRLDARTVDVPWPDVMDDLHRLQAVDLTLDGERYRLRTDLIGAAGKAFAAAGVRPPPILTHLGPAEG